jgi:transposase
VVKRDKQKKVEGTMVTIEPLISIGIDVSKETLVVSGLSASRLAIPPRQFANSHAGVRGLIAFLKQQGTAATAPCVMESTGDYHLLSALMLFGAGYSVKCINPLITKQYQRLSTRDAKSDGVDSVRLASIGKREPNLFGFEETLATVVRKKQVMFLAKLERAKQSLSRQVAHMRETAAQLGFSVDLSSVEEAVALIERQRKQLVTEIERAADNRTIAFADGISGMSREKAAVLDTLLAGRIFANKNQLVAFCGLDVCARRSGMWKGREHLSKRGNSVLRKALYATAWGLTRHDPEYRTYYQSLRARRLHYTTCLIATARKFLRTTWWRHLQSLQQGRGSLVETARSADYAIQVMAATSPG